mgnify:CR=1 FL=1
MATNNDELEKAKKLLKDQVIEVGFLDNAFKTLSASITSAIDSAIDDMKGLDDITQKVAKSYQKDITQSINKATKGLEDQVDLTIKINSGKNVGKEIDQKITANETRRQVTLKKISMLEGISNKDKNKLLGTANEVFKAEASSLKGLKDRNDETQKNKSLLQLVKENAGGLADKLDKSGTLSKVLSGGISSVLTPARLLELAVLGVFDAMVSVDKLNGELAKGLNISYSEAVALSSELSNAANKSGSMTITAAGLGEALMAANGELGIFNTTIDDNLKLFQKLHKTAGLTYEELKGVKSITDATGGDLEQNTKELLAQARLTGQKFGVALNEKEVLKDISKVSKATTLSLGMSTKELSNAVSTAKSLGMEMSQVEGIADGLLNFEQSIQKELEAELLTGKNLNLEKARQFALDNNLAGVAEEIAKQAGSAADFGKMNRIQQEALAGAVGMSREELAKSLFVQEQIGNLTGDEYEIRKKQIEELEGKGLSQKQISAELGKQSIDDLKHQNSIQENMNKSIAKMKEAFVSIAAPLMQIVSPIVDLLIPAFELLSYILVPISATFQGIADTVLYIVDSVSGFYDMLTGANTELSLMQSIVGAIAITYGLIAAYNAAAAATSAIRAAMEKNSEKSLIKQGFIMAKNLLIAIAEAVAKITGASAATLGIAAGIALAAGATAYAFLSTKGNDIMSPGENSSGYGKRTLFGPEGAIALNNKDTVIAGTNLFPKGDDVVSGPAGAIQMPDNSEAKRTNALLEALINKPAPKVQMDSIEVGTVSGMSAFSIQ